MDNAGLAFGFGSSSVPSSSFSSAPVSVVSAAASAPAFSTASAAVSGTRDTPLPTLGKNTSRSETGTRQNYILQTSKTKLPDNQRICLRISFLKIYIHSELIEKNVALFINKYFCVIFS